MLKHPVPLVTAQVPVAGEGGLGGSGVAVQLLHLGWWTHWAVYGEEVCYWDQLWTSCVAGLVLGCLRQPSCRFSCTEQSAFYLIFSFGKLCSNSSLLVNISLKSSLKSSRLVYTSLSFLFVSKENLCCALGAKPTSFCLMREVILLTFSCAIPISLNLS